MCQTNSWCLFFWSARFAWPRRAMFWRKFFSPSEFSFNMTLLFPAPHPDFHKSKVNASEGILMGFIGSKGPLIIKKPHRDLLSALKKNGFASALVKLHTHKKKYILASHSFRKVSGDFQNGGFLFKFFSSPILDNIPPGLQVRNLRSILDISVFTFIVDTPQLLSPICLLFSGRHRSQIPPVFSISTVPFLIWALTNSCPHSLLPEPLDQPPCLLSYFPIYLNLQSISE